MSDRWKPGCQLIYDADMTLTEVRDITGVPVPQEDWKEFLAWQQGWEEGVLAGADAVRGIDRTKGFFDIRSGRSAI